MKNEYILLFLFFICIYSCKTSLPVTGDNPYCNAIVKRGYSRITLMPFESVVKEDTLSVNEIRYECSYSGLYVHKAMFDKYGKWNKSFRNRKGILTTLIWENIPLLENSTEEFTVVAMGLESRDYVYSGVSVFDKDGNDVLTENTFMQEKIKNYFGELIRENVYSDTQFYELYWTSFNSQVWKDGSWSRTKFEYP